MGPLDKTKAMFFPGMVVLLNVLKYGGIKETKSMLYHIIIIWGLDKFSRYMVGNYKYSL